MEFMKLEAVRHIESVYNALEDDISRDLFDKRLEWSISGGYDLARHSFARKGIRQLLSENGASEDNLVFYGAGNDGFFCAEQARRENIAVKCFCDSNPDKWGTMFCGLPVISPDSLLKNYSDAAVFISTSLKHSQVHAYLKKIGYTGKVLGVLWSVDWQRSEKTQYFGESFLTPVEDEIYVDAGAFTGDTVESFSRFVRGGGSIAKIYALEPGKQQYKKLIENTSGIAEIVSINKCAWKYSTRLHLSELCPVAFAEEPHDKTISMEGVSIDELVGDDKVTFIKMDIEGSELMALKGAEKTIKANKPRLAICIYHKVEDVLTIPSYIQSLVPEYRFYIRHYSRSAAETVLYAIV